ncbi:hypothetical protein CK203_100089 [Vitis vinifera]|uniref:Uncharacterized protein n=1 Tax=Vitis vinifera TaxID=29760 RepID=A0A438FLV6_VITVI|nr:hypothetical protein CK203_100089 [Vitis vinifera]
MGGGGVSELGWGRPRPKPAPLPSLLERQVHGLDPKEWAILRKQLIGYLANPAAASSSDMDATTSSTPTADAGLPDGGTSIYSDFLDKWYLLMVVACRMTEDSTGRVV